METKTSGSMDGTSLFPAPSKDFKRGPYLQSSRGLMLMSSFSLRSDESSSHETLKTVFCWKTKDWGLIKSLVSGSKCPLGAAEDVNRDVTADRETQILQGLNVSNTVWWLQCFIKFEWFSMWCQTSGQTMHCTYCSLCFLNSFWGLWMQTEERTVGLTAAAFETNNVFMFI